MPCAKRYAARIYMRDFAAATIASVDARRRGRAEVIAADGLVRVLGPAERGASLDGDDRLAVLGEDALLVLVGLLLEELPARHGHDARLVPELRARLARQLELGAGTDEDAVAVLARGGALDDVRAHRDALLGGARKVGDDLARERESRRAVRLLDANLVRARGLVTVRGAHHEHAGHRAERREVLDRLVRGAVLADADGVVRHDEERRRAGEGGDAHRAAHVIGEDEEGGAVGLEAGGVKRDGVGDGAHAVLADAVTDVTLRRGVLLEVAELLHERHVGRREIGGAADEAGDGGAERVEHRLGVDARRDARVLGGEARERVRPALRKLAGDDGVELGVVLRVLLLVLRVRLLPRSLRFRALRGAVHVRLDRLRDLELAVLPVEVLARRLGLVRAEGRAVDVVRVGLVRGAVADERRHLDEGRAGVLLRRVDRLADGVEVGVTVLDVLHVPAVRLVALADVLREGDVGVAVDGDVVVVVERDELAELPVRGEGRALAGHALHVAAVAHDGVRVVVHDGAVRLVEARREVLLRRGEADGVADAHAERAGRDLDAVRDEVLGVTGGHGIPLAEVLEVVVLRVGRGARGEEGERVRME
eukprot:23048-Pelagococcus_subviridis.AAC.3